MKELKILVFKLNNELFAADIMEVERILGYSEPIKIPDAPEFLKGVVKYENQVIPVLDLYNRFRFFKNQDETTQRIVVVKKEKGSFGIVVDDVSEVTSINEKDIENPEAMNLIVSKRYIKGIIKAEDSLIIQLDLNNILSSNEEELIFEGV